MTSSSPWCLGWPPARGPHVPSDGNLIDTNAGGRSGVMLCRACWTLWVRDHGQADR